jgi:hypothetical protein
MIESIVSKYGRIIGGENNVFLVETNLKAEELKKKLTDELKTYDIEISAEGSLLKVKFIHDLLKEFQGEIKKYNDGVPPEDLKYRCEI